VSSDGSIGGNSWYDGAMYAAILPKKIINVEALFGSDLMAGALKIAPAKNEGRLKMDRMVIGPPCRKRESNSVNT